MTLNPTVPAAPLRRISLLILLSVWSLLLLATPVFAEPADEDKPFLHSLFTDHIVLQRGVKIPVWGWTQPGATVTVTLKKKKASAVAGADGKWMVKLPSFSAGGPYELIVSGPTNATVHDVMIGDVWICSGQSNMEMGIKMVNNATQEIARANNPNIRLFTVPHHIAYRPVETVKSGWLVCSPESVARGGWGGFSAVAYFFGRELEQDLNVPIGLIHTSWGGTEAEAWTSAEKLAELPDFVSAVEKVRLVDPQRVTNTSPHVVTVLYNGMIAPLLPYAIWGVIWYQGESNASRARQYQTLLPAMIQDWRSRFEAGKFPFLIVQLANYKAKKPEPAESDWAALREAQSIAAKRAGNSALALAIDIGDARDIHPKNKQEVGRRLALAARAVAYDERVVFSGPVFRSAFVAGKNIKIKFDHVDGGLTTAADQRLAGFAVAGEDKKFVWADAVIKGKTVIVSSASVEHPMFVRYDWADNPSGNLYNKAGLPAEPFRVSSPR